MNFHILTIFPKIFEGYLGESLIGKAREKKILNFFIHDLRDYALNKHRSVDDSPYGGGSGMVMRADVVAPAVRELKNKFSIEKVFYLSPRGQVLTHSLAKELSSLKNILLLCGRYEGIDQRALDLVVDEEISIGDYVLSGGELAAQVVIDTVARFIPGVIGNEGATLEESHAHGLLEYPHYTRPDNYEGLQVPAVLISGNHEAIKQWRQAESIAITKKRRPDLIRK